MPILTAETESTQLNPPPQSPLKGGGGCGRASSIHRTRAVLSRQVHVGRDQDGAMPGPLVRLGGGVGLNRPRESTSGVEIDLGPCAWWPCCRSLDLRSTFASEPPPTPDLGTGNCPSSEVRSNSLRKAHKASTEGAVDLRNGIYDPDLPRKAVQAGLGAMGAVFRFNPAKSTFLS